MEGMFLIIDNNEANSTWVTRNIIHLNFYLKIKKAHIRGRRFKPFRVATNELRCLQYFSYWYRKLFTVCWLTTTSRYIKQIIVLWKFAASFNFALLVTEHCTELNWNATHNCLHLHHFFLKNNWIKSCQRCEGLMGHFIMYFCS